MNYSTMSGWVQNMRTLNWSNLLCQENKELEFLMLKKWLKKILHFILNGLLLETLMDTDLISTTIIIYYTSINVNCFWYRYLKFNSAVIDMDSYAQDENQIRNSIQTAISTGCWITFSFKGSIIINIILIRNIMNYPQLVDQKCIACRYNGSHQSFW